MKNNVFVLSLIVGLSMTSCTKKGLFLHPEGSYVDECFFLAWPRLISEKSDITVENNLKTADDGFVMFCFQLGNFFQEDGWKLQLNANFYGDKGSKSFFCEVDDIGSEYYKAEYTDEYYGLFSYTYDSPTIEAFNGQIPFSFFQDKYYSILITMTIINGDKKYGTFCTFGTLWYGYNANTVPFDSFGSITKYGN